MAQHFDRTADDAAGDEGSSEKLPWEVGASLVGDHGGTVTIGLLAIRFVTAAVTVWRRLRSRTGGAEGVNLRSGERCSSCGRAWAAD